MRRLIATLLTAFAVPMLVTATTYAWNPFAGLPCGSGQNGSNSAVCKDANNPKQDPISGTNGIILKITTIVAFVAGVFAVIMIIMAGLKLIQSGGNSEAVASARRTIIYSSVGIVVILLARTLIALVLGAL